MDVTQKFIETTDIGFSNGINCPRYQDHLVAGAG